MKLKRLFTWALLTTLGLVANAQNWTWTGETPAAQGSYYLYNVGAASFLDMSNGVPINATDDPLLFTLTEGLDGTDLQYTQNGNTYYVYQSAGNYGYCNDNNKTIGDGPSIATMKSYGDSYRWKIRSYNGGFQIYSNHKYESYLDWFTTKYRHNSDTDRYISHKDGNYSCSKTNSEYNTVNGTFWFITQAQMDARAAYIEAYNTLNECTGEKLISLDLKNRIDQALTANASASLSDATTKTKALTDLKSEFDSYIPSLRYATKEQGKDVSGIIVNPGAEAGSASGWLGEIGTPNNGHQHSGTYLFETAGWGKNNGSMSQTISNLPKGYYKVSAWYIAATETSVQVHGNNVSSVAGQGIGDSQWNQLTTDFVTVKDGTLTIKGTSATTASQNWANFDDFTLTYYGPLSLDEAYEALAAALEECKPWDGASYDTYTTVKADYDGQTYATEEEINNAISSLKAAYGTFCWENASMEHPYLMKDVITFAECDKQDLPNGTKIWDGSGRTTRTGQHWSGDASRVYFTQNHENGAARAQTVTIPNAGVYMLKTSVRIVGNGGYATISVGDETETTTSPVQTTGGTIATDGTEYASVDEGKDAGATFANNNNGYGWVYNKITFATTTANEQKTISIALSNENVGHEADCGGMFLYYVGNKGTLTENGDVITGIGNFDNETITAKAHTTTIDLTNASGSFTIDATANPNVLVYTKGASVSGVTNNFVNNGTCANLVLTDGHPFKVAKNFEATSASYKMTAIATKTDGKTFGTLMLPFAATTMPDGNKVYTLDQGVSFGEEIHATEAAIAANAPVIVTKAGDYTASNVAVAATNDSYTNDELVGTYKAMTAEEGTYVLQKHDTRVAFYLVNDVQPTVNPFRAYIKAQTAGVKAVNIIFDDEEETGIDLTPASPKERSSEQAVYDLAGRRVQKAQKGVYVVNGKKVLK